MHDTIAPMPPRPRPFCRPPLAVRLVAAMPPRLWTLAGRLLALRVRRLTRRPTTAAEARLVGQILVIQGRFAEADAVLATALAAHPLDIGLMARHATSAHNRGDYAEALVRWERLRRAQPDDPSAWRGLAGNARELWDMPAATAAVREALRRFPDDPSILTEAALVANRRLDHAEALGHWTRLLEMRRVRPEVRQGHVYSLMRLNRFAEAEAALTAARGLHPDHAGLSATRAMLAMARVDWDAADALLHDHLIRHPGDAAGLNLVAEVKLARALAEADAGLAAVPPVRAAIDAVEDEPARTLLLGCESLGTDCEFGLVQRRHGAEPLGLLRWNTIPPDGLMRGLAERFAGVGDPANSRLSCLPASGEYYVSDTRLGLYMHTFVTRGSLDEAAFFAKMCVRLAFLRDKFIADLAAGEKLLVYKARGGTRADLEVLHGRLRAYGPVRLLAVHEAGPGEPPGRVEPIADGLCMGTLRHYGDRGGPDWDIAFDDWLAVVEGARAAMPAPPGPGLIG